MSAALPIVERLTRTPANSNRVMPVNPDGPQAARIIEDLYEALTSILDHPKGMHKALADRAVFAAAMDAVTKARGVSQ